MNGQTKKWLYLYDGWDIIGLLNQYGQIRETHTRGVGLAGDIGTLIAVTHHAGSGVTPGTYYTHCNHRGDIVLTRSGTTTVGSYDYSAFGLQTSAFGTEVCRFKFSSKERDPSTGLSYYGYRFYAPQWQRWISRDPIWERGGMNLYGFVANNAPSFVDPLGLGYGNPVPPCFPYPECLRPPPPRPDMWSEFCKDSSGYMACYLDCMGLSVTLDAAGEAGGANLAARAYYTCKYPRWFKARGKYSKVLVPRLARRAVGVLALVDIIEAIRCSIKCYKQAIGQ